MPNPPEEKAVSVTEIGDRLRQAREKKGLTLDQAQKQTHIHSTVLSAMENGRCDDILTPNYVKSFLKEYSNYLGFDHRAIIAEYLTLHPELKSGHINRGINPSDIKASADISRTIRVARSVLIFIVLIALAVFVGSKAVGHFKNLGPSKKIRPDKAIKASSRVAKASASKAAASKSVGEKAPARLALPSRNVPFTMTLKIKNPVMVQLKKDGVLIFKRVLPKGIEETFSVNNSVNMFVGRAESVEIIVNGKSLGAPGRGVIRNIEVTSNGFRVR
ncbi:MAG: DUF4115 domain-containing protein [Candidatus Omnitrophica bacterium]|nr:DUF4115 domain-containing protein [Candidatus Omnitrophota bacterium]